MTEMEIRWQEIQPRKDNVVREDKYFRKSLNGSTDCFCLPDFVVNMTALSFDSEQ